MLVLNNNLDQSFRNQLEDRNSYFSLLVVVGIDSKALHMWETLPSEVYSKPRIPFFFFNRYQQT